MDKTFTVTALLQDQEMHTSIIYWEGAVKITAGDSDVPLGYGYVEMTGY